MSDHSPSTVDLQAHGDGDFGLAWGGIAGLQAGLSAVWTEARAPRHPAGEDPAALHDRTRAHRAASTARASIAVGAPAHLVVFGVRRPVRPIDAAELLQEPASRYDRRRSGTVRRTWLHGGRPTSRRACHGEAPLFRGKPRGRRYGRGREILAATAGERRSAVTVEILQPGTGDIPGDHYLRSTPETVLWGRLPCATDAAVLTIAPGETVTIDTVSHEGILEDQGKDPLAYFGGHGVDAASVLDDAVDDRRDAVARPGRGRAARRDGPDLRRGSRSPATC